MKKFTFNGKPDDGYTHYRGHFDCPGCCNNPFPIWCPCGGFLHDEYSDEVSTPKGEYEKSIYQCDRCGKTGTRIEEPDNWFMDRINYGHECYT